MSGNLCASVWQGKHAWNALKQFSLTAESDNVGIYRRREKVACTLSV